MRPIDADAVLAEIGEFQSRFDETGDSHERVAYASAEHCKLVIKAAPTIEPQKWIPCAERMPEKDTSVLICGAGHRVTAYYDAVFGVFRLTESDDLFYKKSAVTHWMPLPDAPEVTRNE